MTKLFFPGRPAALLLTASTLAFTVPVQAETILAPAEAPPATLEETAPTAEEEGDGDDIVVTAERLSGQLDTEVPAEIELDEAALAS